MHKEEQGISTWEAGLDFSEQRTHIGTQLQRKHLVHCRALKTAKLNVEEWRKSKDSLSLSSSSQRLLTTVLL